MDILDWNKFYWRKLQRDGYCSHCGEWIQKNTKDVLTFVNKKAHYDTVVLCENCCNCLIKFLTENMEIKLDENICR